MRTSIAQSFGYRVVWKLSAALLLCASCSKSTSEKPQAVADLFFLSNGDKTLAASISVFDYRLELARARLEREGKLKAAPLPTELKSALLDQLIDTRILLWKAQNMNVKVSTVAVSKEKAIIQSDLGLRELRKTLIETFQRTADLEAAIWERLVIGKLMTQFVHKGVKVSDQEIKTAWGKIPDKDKRVPKLVRARQIVVQTEEEATELHALLRRGHDFATLAAKRSIGPEGKRGGDLGWFEKGAMPKVFDEACFSLKLGQTSPITPSEYGFHIFEVTGVEPERSLGFDAVKDRIRSKVLHKKLQAAESQFVRDLRSQFEITRYHDVLREID